MQRLGTSWQLTPGFPSITTKHHEITLKRLEKIIHQQPNTLPALQISSPKVHIYKN